MNKKWSVMVPETQIQSLLFSPSGPWKKCWSSLLFLVQIDTKILSVLCRILVVRNFRPPLFTVITLFKFYYGMLHSLLNLIDLQISLLLCCWISVSYVYHNPTVKNKILLETIWSSWAKLSSIILCSELDLLIHN